MWGGAATGLAQMTRLAALGLLSTNWFKPKEVTHVEDRKDR